MITRYYVHGAGLLAAITPADAVYCYHFDGVGNTVAITDSSETVVNSYDYSPFGMILAENEGFSQPFEFVGKLGVMAESNGFYYMRARYYDPVIGRFISEDPLGFDGGDVNLYVYGGNNPLLVVDPWGMAKKPGNTALGILYGQVMRGINTLSPVPLELLSSDPIIRQLTKANPVLGLTLGELLAPTPLGDGTLEGVDPSSWDVDGDGVPDFLDNGNDNCE